MKAIALHEAQSRLDKLFEDAQAGSPVLLVRGGGIARLERVEPPEFGGDMATLEKMLIDAVQGAHGDWTPQDLEDIARRVREKRSPEDQALRLDSGPEASLNDCRECSKRLRQGRES